jgi:hypothetical protein
MSPDPTAAALARDAVDRLLRAMAEYLAHEHPTENHYRLLLEPHATACARLTAVGLPHPPPLDQAGLHVYVPGDHGTYRLRLPCGTHEQRQMWQDQVLALRDAAEGLADEAAREADTAVQGAVGPAKPRAVPSAAHATKGTSGSANLPAPAPYPVRVEQVSDEVVSLLRSPAPTASAPSPEQADPVSRAIALMILFEKEGRRYTVEGLARAVGTSKATLYRDSRFVGARAARKGNTPPQGSKDKEGGLDAYAAEDDNAL